MRGFMRSPCGEGAHHGEHQACHRRVLAGEGEVLLDELDAHPFAGQGVDDPAFVRPQARAIAAARGQRLGERAGPRTGRGYA